MRTTDVQTLRSYQSPVHNYANAPKKLTLIANISIRVSKVKSQSPNLGAVKIFLEIHFLSNEMWKTFFTLSRHLIGQLAGITVSKIKT